MEQPNESRRHAGVRRDRRVGLSDGARHCRLHLRHICHHLRSRLHHLRRLLLSLLRRRFLCRPFHYRLRERGRLTAPTAWLLSTLQRFDGCGGSGSGGGCSGGGSGGGGGGGGSDGGGGGGGTAARLGRRQVELDHRCGARPVGADDTTGGGEAGATCGEGGEDGGLTRVCVWRQGLASGETGVGSRKGQTAWGSGGAGVGAGRG